MTADMTEEHKAPVAGWAAGSVSEILNAAADLIEPEGAWTQGMFARKADGHSTGPILPEAVCFCAVGGLMRAAGGVGSLAYHDAFNRLNAMARRAGFMHVANWNDDTRRTQAEVVAALRQAAKLSAAPGGGEA